MIQVKVMFLLQQLTKFVLNLQSPEMMGLAYFDVIKPAVLPEKVVSNEGNWKECIHRKNHHTDHLHKEGTRIFINH